MVQLAFGRMELALTLICREVAGRYRGSMLGMLWSMLTPLFMLAVYTFVFGVVFRTRWTGEGVQGLAAQGGAEPSTAAFAVVLFAGLIVFQLFAEVDKPRARRWCSPTPTT